MIATRPYSMTSVEIARGYVTDIRHHRGHPLTRERLPGPRKMLETILLEELQRGECVVMFSGGRDSSALLALLAMLAEREGYEPPAAFTRTYPGFKETDETSWQELVIRSVRVKHWERRELDDQALDLLGSTARARLRRFGVVWPPLSHQDVPGLQFARNATAIDGEGGDQILGRSLHRITHIARIRSERTWRRPKRLLGSLAVGIPGRVQLRVQSRRLGDVQIPWLRDDAAQELRADLAREAAAQPLQWDRSIRAFPSHRGRVEGLRTRHFFAAAAEVRYVHPFLDPRFLESMAREGGVFGLGTRTEVMQRLFGDLLPQAIIDRRGKARFNEVLFGPDSRAFVDRWDGLGLDSALIDVDRLREAWGASPPSARTFALLQSAWLAREGDAAEYR